MTKFVTFLFGWTVCPSFDCRGDPVGYAYWPINLKVPGFQSHFRVPRVCLVRDFKIIHTGQCALVDGADMRVHHVFSWLVRAGLCSFVRVATFLPVWLMQHLLQSMLLTLHTMFCFVPFSVALGFDVNFLILLKGLWATLILWGWSSLAGNADTF